jgi:hypothetical protein
MSDHHFARLARFLSATTSRRQALAALGALAAVRRQPTRAATPLEVATCGAAGAVCTHLKSCCEGLVCATSHINANYGVCIPGEGEHLAVTTQLVVPASAGVVEQLAAALAQVLGLHAPAGSEAAHPPAARPKRRRVQASNRQAWQDAS